MSSSQRRPRAPTITIDTSAVQSTPEPSDQPQLRSPISPSFQTSPINLLSVPDAAQTSRRKLSIDSSDGSRTFVGTLSPQASFISEKDPLRPNPGTEKYFHVEDNKFAFSPGQLSKLYDPKSLSAFLALGGPAGLEKGLRTDIEAGLSVDERQLEGEVTFTQATGSPAPDLPSNGTISPDQPTSKIKQLIEHVPHDKHDPTYLDRRRIYGVNQLPSPPRTPFWKYLWIAYNDKVLILLTIAAVVSLAVGIYQSTAPGGGVEWIEGVAICVAIIIVVFVGAVNDFQKEKQFQKLNKKKDEGSLVKVIRSGKTQEINVNNVLVGDIMLLNQGDIAPVDGILLEGRNLACDESSATGESDILKKKSASEVFNALETGQSPHKLDPFILSGAKISDGLGKMLVTAVGPNSSYGKLALSLRDGNEITPLQHKLNVLATHIAKLAIAAALLYFVVSLIEFLVRITRGSEQYLAPAEKGQNFLNIFVVSVSVIVVAVPEGLPLAVTLALAFATLRMLKDNNLVRQLQSCETMGNATTVCSDKTGTLTQNKMSVVAGSIGTNSRFGATDISSAQECMGNMKAGSRSLLRNSITLNTTAFETEIDGKKDFNGSKTEVALLNFAQQHLGMDEVNLMRENGNITDVYPFESRRKCMITIARLSQDDTNMATEASKSITAQTLEITPDSSQQSTFKPRYRLYVKGAPEILLMKCCKIIADSSSENILAAQATLSSDRVTAIQNIISAYATRSLRTLGFAFKDFESWPPQNVARTEDGDIDVDALLFDLTFFCVFGIQDPLREGVTKAVSDCARAGVVVRMVTGDNIQTAKAIASECGILTDGIAMEGLEFRNLTRYELAKTLPRLQVLARSSPEDKQKLVKALRDLGEIVAVTGDGTNDAPALKAADVGFSMGIAGTEIAKTASAIILMDDNFASIVKALMWGRAVNDAVKKFLQFQITVNITAVLITFITGISSSNNTSALTAVQLLWINLIMDTMAALALATDPPADSILDRKPSPRNDSLITLTMWKMIIGQAIYQLTVILVLYYRGAEILSYQSEHEQIQLGTLIFNTFVWMQIFNTLNNRRLDNNFNVFEGVFRNWLFWIMVLIMVGGQILIVFVGGNALSVVRLNAAQWAYSLVIGFLSLPIGLVIRLIPDELIRALIPESLRQKATKSVNLPDERFEWNTALMNVHQELSFIKTFKGGRLNNLKYKIRHPREAGVLHQSRPSTHRSRSSTNTTLPAAAVAAGIIAGSIGGWSPIEAKPSDLRLPL